MRKRKPNFIVKNTSNTNETLKFTPRSSKKTQKNQKLVLLGWIDRPRGTHFILRPFIKDLYLNIFVKNAELKKHSVKMYSIVRASLKHISGRKHEARIQKVYPDLNDPDLEIEIVRENHPFPTEFSDLAHKDTMRESTKEGRRVDLTHAVTVTIDGETAKDFDDAISVDKTKNGNFNLKVSIADVSHFVKEGSQLDKEAYERATSIYFLDRCIPMLPEKLSNDLCSLVPKKERFTLTCEMEISPKGEMIKSRIYPSIIKSDERLTYTTVSKVIEKNQKGLVPSKIEELLHNAFELSQIIKKVKFNRGRLDLDLPELEFELDKTGGIKTIKNSERNEAHKLIEEFMILANETVSEKIEEAGYSSVFRVHEDPDEEKLKRLRFIAKKCGFRVSNKLDPLTALEKYLDEVRGHPNQKMLIVSALRSLKQAQYSATNMGHFGLGSESYCHFTSPIRRYPDLMIHRILRKSNFLKKKEGPYKLEKLQPMAEHCSDRERQAFYAERALKDLKKARFMEPLVGEKFEGVITSVKDFGMFVEIFPHLIEGLIPTRTLPYDVWTVDELETSMSGRKTKIQFDLGDRIQIQVLDVDRLRQQITFRYINPNKNSPKKGGYRR
jgi:ribonuclease R